MVRCFAQLIKSRNSKTLVSIRVLPLIRTAKGTMGTDSVIHPSRVSESFAAGGPSQRVTKFTAFRHQCKYRYKFPR
jgi:hypothetical protein